ncbi:MAG: zinc ribbon domain-containing protein [Actinobacteria bacterium]|nr:zinc ribbon domain-containing protein [Actinomycetota bacterium]
MARYDYRCSTCEIVFEEKRSMADADQPASCPQGHVGARRLLPVFAATGFAAPGAGSSAMPSAPAMGCGGGCVCC